jgi:hypothetical protein
MNSSAMWRASWGLYRNNLVPLLLLFLPLAVAFLVALAPLLTLPDQQIGVAGSTPSALLLMLGFALVVIPMVVGGIGVAASTLLLTDTIVGRSITPTDAFRQVRPHLGPLIAAALASTLLSLVLRQLLPPLEFFLRPMLYGPAILVQVIALEGMDLRNGLSRAGELLRKHTLRIFMFLLAVSMGASLLDILLPGFATLGLTSVNNIAYFIVASVIQVLVVVLTLPFVAATMLVAYFDLRARKEDLNLEQLASEREGTL